MAVEAGGIGARLRAGREKHGLTVLQVAERLHTDPKVVEAIEAESFEALGAPVYARGHIRHYAELVGESGPELVALYSDLSRIAEPDLTRIVKAPASADSSKLVAPALLMIAVFAIAGAIWWVSALSKKKPQLSETHVVGEEAPGSTPAPASESSQTVAGVPGQTTPPQVPEQAPGQAPGKTTTPGQAARETPSRRTTPGQSPGRTPTQAGQAPTQVFGQTSTQTRSAERSGPSGAMAMQARPGAAAAQGVTPPPQSAANGITPPPPAPAIAAGTAPPPPSRKQAQVTLRYSADSWTEVYDASGARLFYDVGAANSVQTLVGTPPLRVVLGNASGVAVEFNGQNKAIVKLSQPDGSVQFFINRSGQVVRAKPVADGG